MKLVLFYGKYFIIKNQM